MSTFLIIRGFDTIDEVKETLERMTDKIDAECYTIYEFCGKYYAVTMHNLDTQFAVSKDLVRYSYYDRDCRIQAGCKPTESFHADISHWDGIHGGASRWRDDIAMDFKYHYGSCPITAYEGKRTGGINRMHWNNNTMILLLLLFCNETRNKDKVCYA